MKTILYFRKPKMVRVKKNIFLFGALFLILSLTTSPSLMASWLPTNVPSCGLWLRGNGLTTNAAGAVINWRDESKKGVLFTNVGVRPATNLGKLNGHPYVSFASNMGQVLQSPPVANYYWDKSFAMHMVVRLRPGAYIWDSGIMRSRQGGNHAWHIQASTDWPYFSFKSANSGNEWDWYGPYPVWKDTKDWAVYSCVRTNGVMTFFINGVLTGTPISNISPIGSGNLVMEIGRGFGGDPFPFDIAEVIYHSNISSYSEFQKGELYLVQKYFPASEVTPSVTFSYPIDNGVLAGPVSRISGLASTPTGSITGVYFGKTLGLLKRVAGTTQWYTNLTLSPFSGTQTFYIVASNTFGITATNSITVTVNPWDPRTLGNCITYLRADYGVLENNSSAVTNWRDTGSSSLNFRPGSWGKGPLYVPAKASFNNEPALRFRSSQSEFLIQNAGTTPQPGSNFSIFMTLAKTGSGGWPGGIFFIGTLNTETNVNWGICTGGVTSPLTLYQYSYPWAENSLSSEWKVQTNETFLLGLNSYSGNCALLSDGILKNYGAINGGKIKTLGGTEKMSFGISMWNNLANFDLAELIIYDRTLSQNETRLVTEYLAQKYKPESQMANRPVAPLSMLPRVIEPGLINSFSCKFSTNLEDLEIYCNRISLFNSKGDTINAKGFSFPNSSTVNFLIDAPESLSIGNWSLCLEMSSFYPTLVFTNVLFVDPPRRTVTLEPEESVLRPVDGLYRFKIQSFEKNIVYSATVNLYTANGTLVKTIYQGTMTHAGFLPVQVKATEVPIGPLFLRVQLDSASTSLTFQRLYILTE